MHAFGRWFYIAFHALSTLEVLINFLNILHHKLHLLTQCSNLSTCDFMHLANILPFHLICFVHWKCIRPPNNSSIYYGINVHPPESERCIKKACRLIFSPTITIIMNNFLKHNFTPQKPFWIRFYIKTVQFMQFVVKDLIWCIWQFLTFWNNIFFIFCVWKI